MGVLPCIIQILLLLVREKSGILERLLGRTRTSRVLALGRLHLTIALSRGSCCILIGVARWMEGGVDIAHWPLSWELLGVVSWWSV